MANEHVESSPSAPYTFCFTNNLSLSRPLLLPFFVSFFLPCFLSFFLASFLPYRSSKELAPLEGMTEKTLREVG